jgi:aminomethyltransferase
MLSYQADMTLQNNPFELGMDRLVNLEMEADFIGKAALMRIREEGVSQLCVGLEIEGKPFVGANEEYWPLTLDGKRIGTVTSAIHSPRLEKNIALAMVKREYADIGTHLVVDMVGESRNCEVVPKPFYDPNKSIASSN